MGQESRRILRQLRKEKRREILNNGGLTAQPKRKDAFCMTLSSTCPQRTNRRQPPTRKKGTKPEETGGNGRKREEKGGKKKRKKHGGGGIRLIIIPNRQ